MTYITVVIITRKVLLLINTKHNPIIGVKIDANI